MRKEVLSLALWLASCQAHVSEMPLLPAGAAGDAARGDIVSFHERAAARTAAGGKKERDVICHGALAGYTILCSVKVPSENGNYLYFTLARSDDGQAALFVWTKDGPVRSLQKAVEVGTYSLVLAPPDRRKGSLDWGWVYDRNGDDWVDYFTYLDGANPVMTDENARLVPKKPGVKEGEPIRIESEEELLLWTMSTDLVFTHHADDNFDGRSDAVVVGLRYPENPQWYYRYGVLRSSALTQVIDEDWSFVSDIRVKAGPVPRENGHLRVSFFQPGERALDVSSELMEKINAGIRACNIPKGSLPREWTGGQAWWSRRAPDQRRPDPFRRGSALDVLACPCGGRLQPVAFIAEATVENRILDHRGLDSRGPPVDRARAPFRAVWRPGRPPLRLRASPTPPRPIPTPPSGSARRAGRHSSAGISPRRSPASAPSSTIRSTRVSTVRAPRARVPRLESLRWWGGPDALHRTGADDARLRSRPAGRGTGSRGPWQARPPCASTARTSTLAVWQDTGLLPAVYVRQSVCGNLAR
jgi:hypothetical protein